ncbi:MAG: glycosyltransferase family 39 protein [Candidatus Peribacteraceae bacterium]|nr:glycosyltransferase family 39 protein [Candidatus Peribacteraceae bacterium]MBP9850305.1 glycosyltransferase family 39 protein [Candidatus Peribacteraceae bacterium]
MWKKKITAGKSNRTEAVLDLIIFIVTIGLLVALRFQVAPVISPATFLMPERETDTRDLPAFFDSVAETMVALVTIELKSLRPGVFAVQVDDCIERLAVNGVSVIPEQMNRLCSPHDLTRINLRPYLRTGKNSLSMSISDIGVTQGLSIQPSHTDPLLLGIWLAIAFAIAWYAYKLRSLLPASRRWPVIFCAVLLFGLFVRMLYDGATPYNLRAHDLEGHVDYITYMQQHWSIPIAKDGWEFHQPPLYYAMAALWLTVLSPLGLPKILQYQSLAGWSLVLSVLTFTVALYCLRQLFGESNRRDAVKAGMMIAVFSSLVFFASRITNEALSAFLTVSTIALLLLWWKRGDRTTLVALSLVFALGILAKISILALGPALAVALLFRSGRSWKIRFADIVIASLVVVLAAGWYPVHRFFLEPEQEKTLSLGNDGMDATLAVPRDFKHLVTLNPVQVVTHPFNDPWDDTFRRGYFLEYFFRSAFFGEYTFERYRILAQTILILALLLVPALLFGILIDFRRRFYELLPFHVVMLGMVLAAFLYPYLFPFAPNQDFRFSVILILPAAYYIVRGIESLPLWLRIAWRGIFAAFVIAAFCFIVALFINA